jgi:hypothetical protein
MPIICPIAQAPAANVSVENMSFLLWFAWFLETTETVIQKFQQNMK